MTEILAGPGKIFPKEKNNQALPPMGKKPRAESVRELRSLNRGFRER